MQQYRATVTDPNTYTQWNGYVMKDLNRYCATITVSTEPYILYLMLAI